MNLNELKEIMRVVVENDISEFEYEEADVKIKIKRSLPAAAASSPVAAAASNSQAPVAPDLEKNQGLPAPGAARELAVDADNLHVITSPIVGTFYRATSPAAEPFVRIGHFVEEGSVLCIIEAMKIMNEIKADLSGEVVRIFVENAQPVEYGQPLFAIRKR